MLRWKKIVTTRKAHQTMKEIDADAIEEASKALLRLEQKRAFPREYEALVKQKQIKTGPLAKLSPMMKDGVMYMSGRLNRAVNMADILKNPPIVPKLGQLKAGTKSYTQLLIEECHHDMKHGGASETKYELRLRAWVISAHQGCSSIMRTCLDCIRFSKAIQQQQMADLPEARVDPFSAPISVISIDYCGPFDIVTGLRKSTTVKAYILVVKCLATKGVILEVVGSMSGEAHIAALHRVFAHTGLPRVIYSDRGGNFIKSERILREFVSAAIAEGNEEIRRYCADKKIKFRLNPSYAKHTGGIHESEVKVAKAHLKKYTWKKKYTFEGLQTLVKQIQAVMLSRPLAPITDDPLDCNVITAANLMIGRSIHAIPEPDRSNERSTNQYVKLQRDAQEIQKAYARHVFQLPQTRPKWNVATKSPKVGQLMLVKVDGRPPQHWKTGRIHRLIPDNRGLVRMVEIIKPVTPEQVYPNLKNNKASISERLEVKHINQLILLPCDAENETEDEKNFIVHVSKDTGEVVKGSTLKGQQELTNETQVNKNAKTPVTIEVENQVEKAHKKQIAEIAEISVSVEVDNKVENRTKEIRNSMENVAVEVEEKVEIREESNIILEKTNETNAMSKLTDTKETNMEDTGSVTEDTNMEDTGSVTKDTNMEDTGSVTEDTKINTQTHNEEHNKPSNKIEAEDEKENRLPELRRGSRIRQAPKRLIAATLTTLINSVDASQLNQHQNLINDNFYMTIIFIFSLFLFMCMIWNRNGSAHGNGMFAGCRGVAFASMLITIACQGDAQQITTIKPGLILTHQAQLVLEGGSAVVTMTTDLNVTKDMSRLSDPLYHYAEICKTLDEKTENRFRIKHQECITRSEALYQHARKVQVFLQIISKGTKIGKSRSSRNTSSNRVKRGGVFGWIWKVLFGEDSSEKLAAMKEHQHESDVKIGTLQYELNKTERHVEVWKKAYNTTIQQINNLGSRTEKEDINQIEIMLAVESLNAQELLTQVEKQYQTLDNPHHQMTALLESFTQLKKELPPHMKVPEIPIEVLWEEATRWWEKQGDIIVIKFKIPLIRESSFEVVKVTVVPDIQKGIKLVVKHPVVAINAADLTFFYPDERQPSQQLMDNYWIAKQQVISTREAMHMDCVTSAILRHESSPPCTMKSLPKQYTEFVPIQASTFLFYTSEGSPGWIVCNEARTKIKEKIGIIQVTNKCSIESKGQLMFGYNTQVNVETVFQLTEDEIPGMENFTLVEPWKPIDIPHIRIFYLKSGHK